MAQPTKVTVKKGDTVSAIAKSAGVSVAAVAAANPQIANLSKINVGQKIVIPTVTPTKTSSNTYAGGVTGGSNPFTAGSGVNTTTLEGILKASGVSTTATTTIATTTTATTVVDPTKTTKTEIRRVTNADGTVTIIYNDGTTQIVGTPSGTKTVIDTIQNADGTTTIIYSDGTSTIVGTPKQTITTDDVNKAVSDAVAALNATWQSKLDALTATQKANQQAQVTTALEDFKANLRLAGLDSLAETIDGYIKSDMTASQIKINLVGTQAYKDRFPGMADLAKAGRAVNEATYISMERGMTSILKAYGLDDKIFGTTEKLGTVIANQVSVAEYEQRVSMASDKVKKNTDVLAALNEYYGVTTEGAISYLLDPKLGMDIVKKQIRASEIGAAAEMYKFDLDKAAAESYINVTGTADLNSLKESFGRARILAETQTRLASIEGDKTYNELQAVATTLGNDQIRMLESQRRALREQARFAGQSGVSGASLRTESNI
jgi:murein DD-endopeptidase MepM/ murein hydrolase activator NlpD